MTARKPMPEIAPCPRPRCEGNRVVWHTADDEETLVECSCGWRGPWRRTPRSAILAWNRRASDSDAEQLKSLEKDVRDMLSTAKSCGVVAWRTRLELAILELDTKRGEVLAKKGARKR